MSAGLDSLGSVEFANVLGQKLGMQARHMRAGESALRGVDRGAACNPCVLRSFAHCWRFKHSGNNWCSSGCRSAPALLLTQMPGTLVFDYPSVRAVTEYLAAQMLKARAASLPAEGGDEHDTPSDSAGVSEVDEVPLPGGSQLAGITWGPAQRHLAVTSAAVQPLMAQALGAAAHQVRALPCVARPPHTDSMPVLQQGHAPTATSSWMQHRLTWCACPSLRSSLATAAALDQGLPSSIPGLCACRAMPLTPARRATSFGASPWSAGTWTSRRRCRAAMRCPCPPSLAPSWRVWTYLTPLRLGCLRRRPRPWTRSTGKQGRQGVSSATRAAMAQPTRFGRLTVGIGIGRDQVFTSLAASDPTLVD